MFSLSDAYFDLENMQVRVITTHKVPVVETSGISIKETEVGRELTVPLWVAMMLIDAGLARFTEDGVTDEEWTQIHYRERFQPLGKPSPLPDDFYSKVYLTFMREMRVMSGDSVSAEKMDRMRGRFRDILESRIAKITRIASAEVTAPTRGLQPEETALYKDLFARISSWRRSMKTLGDKD